MAVKRSVRRVEINYSWQQAYLVEFPELKRVAVAAMDEEDAEGGEDWDPEAEDKWGDDKYIEFVLSSCIPATVKSLSLDWCQGIQSLAALAHLVNLEELELDLNGVRDGTALVALPKLETLSIKLSEFAESEDHAFLSRLCHLRKFSVAIVDVRAKTFPVLSPVEDVSIMYGTGDLSVDPLVKVGPQLKRLSFEASMFFTITAPLGAALTSIQELDLTDVHFGSSPEELAVVSRLTTLKKLYFPVEDEISSLAPLSTLTQLEELGICPGP